LQVSGGLSENDIVADAGTESVTQMPIVRRSLYSLPFQARRSKSNPGRCERFWRESASTGFQEPTAGFCFVSD